MTLAQRNRDLAERNREVRLANLAKSRFLAAASHDLRQPLHALNLFAAQLRDQTTRLSAPGSSHGSTPPSIP